jgi:succinoglycan biosynthesis transport protein ExoP
VELEKLPEPRPIGAGSTVGLAVPDRRPNILPPPNSWEKQAPGDFFVTWRVLCRSKWTLIGWTIIGLAAGLVVTAPEPSVDKARTSLEVQGLNEDFLNMKQALPVKDADVSAGSGDIQTQILLLQSDRVLGPVLARMPSRVRHLTPPAHFLPFWPSRLRWLRPPTNVQSETRRLASTLKVLPMGPTRMIEVTAESSDPIFVAEFLNQMSEEFIQQNIKARGEMSQRTSQSLMGLLEEMREKLRQSEGALQDYAQTSGLMFTSDRKNVAEEKLSRLQNELSDAVADRIAKQSQYESAKTKAPEALPDTSNQSSLPEYQGKLADLRRERAALAVTYTPRQAKVKSLDAQIASLQDTLDAEKHNVTSRIENDYQQAVRREALLSAGFNAQSQLVSELDQRAVQYNILQRELDSNRQLYDSMLQRAKEATIASAMRASNVRVVDPAKPPRSPARPRPMLNSALGLLIGSCTGLLLAFVRWVTDSRLREPGDAQNLSLRELGAVQHDPHGRALLRSFNDRDGLKIRLRIDSKSWLNTMERTNLFGRADSDEPRRRQIELVEQLWQQLTEFRPGSNAESSVVLESCRSVATSLLLAGTATRRVLVMTSAGPQEGKTTLVCNLGLMLAAHTRLRVLLVDADLRQHRLNELFGLTNGRGLSSLLRVGLNSAQSLDDFVQKTCVPGLSVLTSGPAPESCVNLLHGQDFSQLLRRLKEEYDIVLIDTPPLHVADARLIARAADGVILVVRAGQTAREAAAAAYERLSADDSRILGMILNDWKPQSSARDYYRYNARQFEDA